MRLRWLTNTAALLHEYGYVDSRIRVRESMVNLSFKKKDSNLMQDMQASFNYLNIR